MALKLLLSIATPHRRLRSMSAAATSALSVYAEGMPPTFTAASPALCLRPHAVVGLARACTLHLPHGQVRTPVFMPVGTKGTIKVTS